MTKPSTSTLLSTKLYRPPLPPDHVERAHLLELLNGGRSRPLTLVSAPAGYGKSVIVSNWLEATDWPSVWVSLDEDDSSLKRFIGYLTAAVCQRFPNALQTSRSLSLSSDLPGVETVATILSNELNAIDEPFILVFDDYQRLSAGSSVQDLLRLLLDRPPIPMHLVLLTRRDPPLPLGRLRALGQVAEVRMQDLRFTAMETREFLERVAHIHASEAAVANLDRELEGWVAGLRLLTLALRHVPDTDAFLADLRGGTQHMQSYLIGEVVAGLPAPTAAWLLRTALLDRFCAPLCDAVCGTAQARQSDAMTGDAFLQSLRSANLFLIPLDADGTWFRLHHLFQHLLRMELTRRVGPEEAAEIHMRACAWFEQEGLIEDAIRSALSAGRHDAAADIVDRHWRDEMERMDLHNVDRWLAAVNVPSEGRPGLQLAEGYVAYNRYNLPRLEAVLQNLAPAIEEDPALEHLLGDLRCLQGMLALRMGDGENSRKLLLDARQRFSALPRRGIAGTAAVQEVLSLSMCGGGEEALAEFEELADRAANDHPTYYSLLLCGLVYASYLQGDLTRLAGYAARLQTVPRTPSTAFSHGIGIHFQACSDLQRGDFKSAAARFGAMAQQRHAVPRHAAFVSMSGLALSLQFLHEDAAATSAVHDLFAFAHEMNDQRGLAIAQSCEAHVRFLQGDLDAAVLWAGVEGPVPALMELIFMIEISALTRARIWVAQGTEESLRRARDMLKHVEGPTQQWHLTNQAIDVGTLKATILARSGLREQALDCLAETLRRAAPGGWLRPFLEVGHTMADLLGALETDGRATDFSRQTRREMEAWLDRRSRHGDAASDTDAKPEEILHETLTRRELEILNLLAHRLQNKQIAKELSVSPETVKTHLKRLYAKLGVSSRREAAAKARAGLAASVDMERTAPLA